MKSAMVMDSAAPDRPHVVVVGAGFGGLETVHRLAGAPVRITAVDRRNHHLFQPLLYQVATASLATSEIAWPIRQLLRRRSEVTTLLATVDGIDKAARRVILDDGSTLTYDTLVVATGARHAYFGHDDWEPFAPGLKTLEDATTIRRRILVAFEKAERETDPQRRSALLTFVIIGAGPTGVELAGTIAELARVTLPRDFRHIDTRQARVVLIEAGSRVLAGFTEDLSAYAQRSLEGLGVEVELGHPVSACTADGVVYGEKTLAASTIIWAAGVQASPAGEWLSAPVDRAGRVCKLLRIPAGRRKAARHDGIKARIVLLRVRAAEKALPPCAASIGGELSVIEHGEQSIAFLVILMIADRAERPTGLELRRMAIGKMDDCGEPHGAQRIDVRLLELPARIVGYFKLFEQLRDGEALESVDWRRIPDHAASSRTGDVKSDDAVPEKQ